jgi:UTP-glucose-1-phosphate uridylyltransferase
MVTKEELDKVLSGIEESKIVISKERDKLRDLFSELSELLESFNNSFGDNFLVSINNI